MEIVVVGRHTEVQEKFRQHVADKLARLELLALHAQRVDVEITHERNPRQSGCAERIELTVRGRGPVIRAEACADDREAALDLAIDKLAERLRRARERRKARRRVVPETTATPAATPPAEPPAPAETPVHLEPGDTVETTLGDSPVVIRQKVHAGRPMSIDDALYEMELVGHDFFLFVDQDTGLPSVVYRRRGWSYGVISLTASAAADGELAEAARAAV